MFRRCGPPCLAALIIVFFAGDALAQEVRQQGKPEIQEETERPRRSTRSRRARVRAPEAPKPKAVLDLPAEGGAGHSQVTAGWLPVLDILSFMQRTTGRIVVYPCAIEDPHFRSEVMINFLGHVQPFDVSTARAVLEANGYVFIEETLSNGTKLLHVRHIGSRALSPIPVATEIISAGERVPPGDGDRLATLVVSLKHLDTRIAVQALRDLLDVTGTASGVGGIKIVLVDGIDALIIKAKMKTLRYIQELVKQIDVETLEPAAPRGEDR